MLSLFNIVKIYDEKFKTYRARFNKFKNSDQILPAKYSQFYFCYSRPNGKHKKMFSVSFIFMSRFQISVEISCTTDLAILINSVFFLLSSLAFKPWRTYITRLISSYMRYSQGFLDLRGHPKIQFTLWKMIYRYRIGYSN